MPDYDTGATVADTEEIMERFNVTYWVACKLARKLKLGVRLKERGGPWLHSVDAWRAMRAGGDTGPQHDAIAEGYEHANNYAAYLASQSKGSTRS